MTLEDLTPVSGDGSARVVVNGLETQARLDRELIEGTLLPALSAAAARPRASRRALAYLVGPPGVGKSTLAGLLTEIARHRKPEPLDLGAVGIDGFHYPHGHLSTHHVRTDGGSTLLSAIKGAPETFDVAALARHIEACAADRDVVWPGYDRRLHDVVPGTEPVTAEVVLVEGNWLLLDEPGWRDLATYAAFVIHLTADAELLRDRLIERKVRGGLTPAEAAEFYERSDRRNIERVATSSDLSKVDLTLHLQADGTLKQGDPA